MATNQRWSIATQLRLAGVLAALVLLILFISLNFASVEVDLVITQLNT